MYKGEKIIQHFENKKYNNIDIEFSFEDKPLGTAGSVKNALKNHDEDFLVISGDAMCDFDLSKAINFHKQKNSMATILLKKVNDPREYGLVNINDSGKVESFIEKPSFANCNCDNANTGIYILSSKVLDLIPENTFFDFAMDLFPKMLEKDMPIYGYIENGYWCDIGNFESYVKCQKDILLNKVKCDIKANYYYGVYHKGEFPQGEFNIDPPVYIGENVIIGENAQLNCGTVIGDNVTIGDESILNQSIVLNSTYISDNVKCNNAIICENAKILRSSNIFEGCVIGKDSVINEHVTISNGSKIWNEKNVPKYSNIRQNIKMGYPVNISFDDDGICGEINLNITPLLCSKIGSAVASLGNSLSIAIASNNQSIATPFKHGLISGILASGGNVFDFNQNVETQFEFCMKKSEVDFGIYIDIGRTTKIKVLQKGALPLIREFERKIENFINKDEYLKVNQNNFGKISNLSSFNKLYEIDLARNIVPTSKNTKIKIISKNSYIENMLSKILKDAGGTVIGDNVTIGDESILNQSIVLNSTYISDNVKCNNAVICENAKILRSSNIFEGCVVGKDSVINEHVTISNGSKIWNEKNVPKYSSIRQNIKMGYPVNISFDDDGICGEINLNITPLLCSKIGSAVASLGKSLSIAIASNNQAIATPFKHGLISGILASGGNVFDYNQNVETQFEFCMKKSEVDFGIYIDIGRTTKIKVLQKGALPLIREFERKIENFINKDEYIKVNQNNFGKISNLSSFNKLYEIDLARNIVPTSKNTKIKIISKNSYIENMLSKILKDAGYNIDDNGIYIYISDNGKSLSMYSEETGYIFYEKLFTLSCLTSFIKGDDVAVSYNAPKIINKIADKYNKKVLRYYNFPYDNSDNIAREMSVKQSFLKDTILMSINILNFLNQNDYTLKHAIDLIPHFATSSRTVSVSINPSLIIKKLHQNGGVLGEGVNLNHENGEILIRPLKSGKGLRLFAESVKTETASEICDFFEDIIKNSY